MPTGVLAQPGVESRGRALRLSSAAALPRIGVVKVPPHLPAYGAPGPDAIRCLVRRCAVSRAMVDLLLRQMDSAWEGFLEALDGLTDEEYHWRPSADAFTLRHVVTPDSEDWPGDPVDGPTKLSTIELKIAHVATCKIMYVEYAFREGRFRWQLADLRVPTTLAAMRPYCAEAHRSLRGFVETLSDVDLPLPRKTNWGASWPTEKIVWTMIAHDVYHGAQIRTMRAVYRATRAG